MNSIWNKNIDFLKNRFPDLYQLKKDDLLSALPKGKASLPVDFPCGWNVRFAKNGDLTAMENGAALHSSYNPTQEADKLAESIVLLQDESKKDITVFFGFGLGYAPVALAKKNPNAFIVLVEPDLACFATALYCLDFSDLFGLSNLVFLVGAGHDSVVAVLEHYGLSRCHFVRNKSLAGHAKSYFDGLDTLVERNLSKHQINQRTLEKFAGLWRNNSCRNLNKLVQLDGIARYNGLANNLPACVLAAGPTLDDMLPYLMEIKKRCLVVCVDTALRACLRVGVEPDFIVLVDPQYWNSRHIADLSSPSSVLVSEIAAYPSVMRFRCKEKILCSSLYPLGKFFERFCGEKGSIGAGGSVATTAWDFARYCGCPEIFIAGLDLGFPEKKTHAKGSLFEERNHAASCRISTAETSLVSALFSAQTVVAEDYNGKPLASDNRMSLYAWWFESKVASCPLQPTYSLTHSSLKIPGIMPFDIENLLNRPVADVERKDFFYKADSLKKEFDKSLQSRKENFQVAYKSLLDNLNSMKQNALQGIEFCDDILSFAGTSKFFEAYQETASRLKKIDFRIMSSKTAETASLVFPTEQQLEQIFSKERLPQNPHELSFAKSRIIYRELVCAIDGYISLLT